MNDERREDAPIVTVGRRAGVLGGVLGLSSLVTVLAGEVARGADFMGSSVAVLAGWAGFASVCLLALALVALAVRYGPRLSAAGSWALALLVVATAVTAGAASTLALVVPTLAERAPAIANDPPAAVPATFILSGLAMGLSGLVLMVALRRAVPALPQWVAVLGMVASVVAMAPLPSRSFLLSFAVAAVLVARRVGASTTEAVPALAR